MSKHILKWGCVLVLVTAVFGQEQNYLPGQFWIVLKPEAAGVTIFRDSQIVQTNNPLLNGLLERFRVQKMTREMPNAREDERDGELYLKNVYRIGIADPRMLPAAIAAFDKNPAVLFAEPIPVGKILQTPGFTPNDPLFSTQWALQKIQAPQAWEIWGDSLPTAETVTVAIFDSGVEWDHPDLIGNIWVNPGEDVDGDGVVGDYDSLANGGDLNGVDDDGNGYIDDLVGWDFCGATIGNPNNPTFQPDNNPHSSPNPGDDGWLMHGTHVAGCASAVTHNGLGVASPGFNAKIMPIKFAFDDDVSHATQGIYEQPAAYLYAAQNGADFINCSYGYDTSSVVVQSTINIIYDTYNCQVIAAAGNDNNANFNYPAAYDHVIAIAATDVNDFKASFSSYGSFVDFSAPGVSILSTVYQNVGSGYQALSGTSMASPTAAGAFALLKAFFPNQSPAWLENRMKEAADDIDGLNPNFAGQLGAGRINLYRAIAQIIYPELRIAADSLAIDDQNGDGQLTPGESASLTLTLENISINNIAAEGVTAVLRSNNPMVVVNDSTALFPDIAPGNSGTNLNDRFEFSLDPAVRIGEISFELIVSANTTTTYPYRTSLHYQTEVSIYQVGWPQPATGGFKNGNIVADFDPQPGREVIAVTADGTVYAWAADGTALSGFPLSLGGEVWGSPALGDVDGNGDPEIVITNRNGHVYALNHDGSILLDVNTGEDLQGTPALADLDQTGDVEIILGSFSGKVYVIDQSGNFWGNFPLDLGISNRIAGGIAVGDVNADMMPDLVCGTYSGNVYAISADSAAILPGFPANALIRVTTTPAIADLDGAGPAPVQIITGSWGRRISLINGDGSVAAFYTLPSRIETNPSISDLDGDGSADIIFGTNDNELYAIHANGDVFNGFPININGHPSRGIALADLDGSGSPEIVLAAADGNLLAIRNNGSHFTGFPVFAGANLAGIPTLADLDEDGDPELVTGTAASLNIYDIPSGENYLNYWFTDQANFQRTANFGDIVVGISENASPDIPRQFRLRQNYPNPFNPSTTIVFDIPTSAQIHLEIYDVGGRRIRTLLNSVKAAGVHRIKWDGKNEAGLPVASGIYVYHLRAIPSGKAAVKAFKQSRKLLLIR
jgi:subtilisin family serine protease